MSRFWTNSLGLPKPKHYYHYRGGSNSIDEDPNEEMEEEIEVVEFVDKEEALVIRRNLSFIQKEEEN